MRSALILSLGAHLVLVMAADLGARFGRDLGEGPQYIDVSLVSFSSPAVATGPPESAVITTPVEPSPSPPTLPPEAETGPDDPGTGESWTLPTDQSVPEVAELSEPPAEDIPPAVEEAAEEVVPDEVGGEEEPERAPGEEPPVVRKSPLKRIAPSPAKGEQDAGGDEGSAGKAQTAGVGTGAITVDSENFHFSYYLVMLRNKIGAHWSPAALGGSGEALSVTVYFRITKSGALQGARVEKSSGNAFFDQSALRAVVAASPLAPLPREFSESSLGVHFEFLQLP